MSAASGQISRFYDLTGGTASGMSDAKLPDIQAGYEKAYNHALVGNAGANLIYESAGMLASLLGFSLEGLIIDNDVIGAVQRTIKGIEVTDESLSLETIRQVCLEGPGHYLGSEQTLQLMQKRVCLPERRRSHQSEPVGGGGEADGGRARRAQARCHSLEPLPRAHS